jgi:hypothetical protein
MGSPPKHLTSRQIERLKSELAEVIITNFCYPSFFDYRLDTLRNRPVDRRKRQEVWAYINGLPFGPLTPEDASTIEFRRFVERVFLRYIEINRGVIGAISARRVVVARSRVSELAARVIKDLGEFLSLGDSSTFGLARPVESWGSVRGKPEPTWEQIERSTQLLQTTLVYLHTNAAKDAEQAARSALATPAVQPVQAAPAVQPAATSPVAQAKEAPASGVADVSKATPAVPQREESAAISISALPTQLLPSRPAQGVSHPVLGSKGNAREYETVPLEFPSTGAPIPRRQFSPLSRPRTASRPVGAPPPAPAPPPAGQHVDVAGLETIKYPLVPPAGASASRSGPGLPPVPPDQAAGRTPPGGLSSGPVSPPLPSSAGQTPPAGAGAEDETWLSILSETSGEHALGSGAQGVPSSADGNSAPVLDSGQVLTDGAGSLVGPYGADLPDLPESFPLPELTSLPPDLAELYGDYLRDSRSGTIDPAVLAAAKEPPTATGGVAHNHASASAPEQETGRRVPPEQMSAPARSAGTTYFVAPEKAEVDALIAALADHLAEQPMQARQEVSQGRGAPSMPATLHPFPLSDPLAQARGLPPVSAVSAAPQAPPLAQPSGPVVAEHTPPLPEAAGAGGRPAEALSSGAAALSAQSAALPGSAQPPDQAGPVAGMSAPAPVAAPTTVPLTPRITQELQPLSGYGQDASGQDAWEDAEGGANAARRAFSSTAVPDQPEKEMSEADVLIFVQLQHQVSTWVKIAAVSHQIEITGQDIPELVAELRHTAALEEAELQVIESLVGLCQRVTTTRQATMDDYKQAMMLYLLHHRSRLAL